MTQSLTTLTSRVQAQLIDDGTRFTTATCTAAIRAALSKINAQIPIHAGTRIDVVAEQKEYELTAEDDLAVGILDVLDYDLNTAAQEDHQPLKYDAYTEDERWFFRLRSTLDEGELLVRYVIHHTINGLDNGANTSLSDDLCQILTDGACAEAIIFRAASRVETINLQQAVSDNYREIYTHFLNAFNLGIQAYKNRRAPVSEPRKDAWNDRYHSWDK